MTTASAKMTSGGAGSLAAYLMEEELVGYYATNSGRDGKHIRSFGEDDVIFRADQLHGGAVAAMGIDLSRGGLTFGQFRNLCEGRHADTGEQLVVQGHRIEVDPETGVKVSHEARTMAIDTFYAAPKSVSLLCIAAASAGRDDLVQAVIKAHEDAVREAHGFVEAECRLGRRTVKSPSQVRESTPAGIRLVTKPGHERQGQASRQQGSQSERIPVQLIAITATQHTARPNDKTIAAGRLPDPHLHSHDVQMCIGYDDVAKRYVALDDYGLKSTAKRRDADYMGALFRNLQHVGVELETGRFEDGKNGRSPWRVKGISPEAEKHFSTNHERVWSLRQELESISGKAVSEKAVQEAMRHSRHRKNADAKAQDSAPVYELWAQEAAAAGKPIADRDLVARLNGAGHSVAVEPWEERQSEFYRRFYGEAGVAKDDAEFSGKEVAEAISRCAEGLSFTVDDRWAVELEVMEQLHVQVADQNPAKVRYTTEAVVRAEQEVSKAFAQKARTTGLPRPTRADVASAIAGLDVEPDVEQLAAISRATAGPGLTVIMGHAGTGKTTSLKAVVDAGRRPGAHGSPTYDQVIVVSTASLTARGTGAKVGADLGCSIESFLRRVDKKALKMTPRTLVIHDEAAMANTWATRRLLKAAGPAQLVMVGDPEQAQPIGPGGTFTDAARAHGAVELTRVWRHQDHRDTHAFALLRQGRSAELLDSLDQRGRLHVSTTHAERVDLAIDYLKAYRDSGRSAQDVRLIFDSSNRSVDEANRHVQQDRVRRGELGQHSITVETRAEDRRWKIHQHDLVMFLRPHKCGQTFVPNGATGTVVGLDPIRNTASVALDQGTSNLKRGQTRSEPKVVQVSLAASAEHQPLGLAYAVHTAKFQGSEVPVVLAVPAGAGRTNRNTAYSTLTRCVEEAHVFADHETHGSNAIETLKGAWAMSSDKRTASSRQSPDAARVASAPSKHPAGQEQQDLEPRARAARSYEYDIERVAGPELARRIIHAPAYPTLVASLETLKATEASEKEMLAKAVRQHQLETARDPAAALVYRLDRMPPIPAESSSLGLNRPADPAQERRDDAAPRRAGDEARELPHRDRPAEPPHRAGPASQGDNAMRRALEMAGEAESRRSARERNEPTQQKDNDQTMGRELS